MIDFNNNGEFDAFDMAITEEILDDFDDSDDNGDDFSLDDDE